MVKLIVDDVIGRQLGNLNTPVDLCDVSGRVLGQFIPHDDFDYQQAVADGCPYSEEELRNARNETGGCSLAEIWRELGQK
jgi:hypothetical protein